MLANTPDKTLIQDSSEPPKSITVQCPGGTFPRFPTRTLSKDDNFLTAACSRHPVRGSTWNVGYVPGVIPFVEA